MSTESPIKFFSGNASRYVAEDIVKAYGTKLGNSSLQVFSDGEFQPCLDETVRGHQVFIIQSTFAPTDNLLELMLMVDSTLR